jgi:glutamyl-tRNA synthetase
MAAIIEIRTLARKYAIKNAVDFGKASSKNVMAKVMQEAKGSGVGIAEISRIVEEEVAAVNAMGKENRSNEYSSFEKEFEEKARETAVKSAQHDLSIDGAEKGKVVTRFPPEPGGYIHIGNAKQSILSDEIARLYEGKINLYFDDTNPEKCRQEYVDQIKIDTAWLGIKFAEEYYASDSIEDIYKAGKVLIENGNAYACMCSEDEIKERREKLEECKHRSNSKDENMAIFNDMLSGKYNESDVIIRLMGDMASQNASFRDPTLFRIKKANHYRHGAKYVVWPTYHMNTPIIDSIHKVTDVVRGKEYEIWEEVNMFLLKCLGIKPPRMHYEARLNIKGTTTAKRDIRKLISDGTVLGWDDPRLPTIAGLRRRGIQPDAIRKFVLRFGMSKTDGIVGMDMLLAENKKIIDPIAKHLFFVPSPKEITIDGAKTEVRLPLNPYENKESREYLVGTDFYIPGKDAESLNKGDIIRLKGLFGASIDSISDKIYARKDPDGTGKTVQWVSKENCIKARVYIPSDLYKDDGAINPDSLSSTDGYVEAFASKLNKGDIVQFERFGYCILDNKEEMNFIFASK